MGRILKRFVFAALFTCHLVGAAQQLYEIDTLYPVHSLDHVLRVYPDSSEVLTPKKLLDAPPSEFLHGDELPRYLEVGTTYWGKLKILAEQPLKGWTLHFQDKQIGIPAWGKSNGKVDVFGFVSDSLLFHKKTGVEYAKKERDVQAHWVLNQVSLDGLPINTPVTLIIKAEGNALGHPAYFNLSARSPKQPFYHQIYQYHNTFNVFMFGVALIIFLYHLLQFFYVGDRVTMWFTIWSGFCMLTMAMAIGLFIGSITKFRFEIWMLIANGLFYSFWFFGRAFIGSKRKFPLLDKFILGLALLLLGEIVFVAVYSAIFRPQTYFSGIGIHYNFIQLYVIASLVMSVILIFKKDLFARYFGWGSIIGSVCLLIGTLWAMQILRPQSKYFVDPFATGMFLQIIFYSFAIAYRRQSLAKQSERERLEAERARVEMLRMKDLDELKTRFFTNISHEFRTPLTLIQGPIQQAKKSYGNGQEITLDQKDFEIVQRNSDRLQSLVDELLELSQLESGKTVLTLVYDDVMPVVKATVFSFESMAERSEITMIANFQKDSFMAYFDRQKLEKITYNLMSNALKYTPPGGKVAVHVNVADDMLHFTVSDTGKGISQEDLPLVFDRFYRVEGSEEMGSGIGLALTKELVELHNGTLVVDSILGQYTTFELGLPITIDKLPDSSKIISAQPSNNAVLETSSETRNQKTEIRHPGKSDLAVALVVEDNADLRTFIQGILKNAYTVVLAEDGEKGVALALERIPDIIVTDVMMSKKDGFELCRDIKSDSRTSHIPIIMLTAKAGQENKMEGLKEGADAYLTKPFSDQELLIRMRNLLAIRDKIWQKLKDTDGLLVDDLQLTSLDDTFLKKVFKTIDEHLDDTTFSVELLSKYVGFSRAQLHRKLKALLNKSPNQLISEIRLNAAHKMLRNKTGNVSEVAYSVGFSNLSYFSKCFKEKFGVPPSEVPAVSSR